MIFYSTYDILDEVFYKNTLPGIIVDVQFTLSDDGVMEESYGIQFENGAYQLFIDPEDLSYRQIIPQTSLS